MIQAIARNKNLQLRQDCDALIGSLVAKLNRDIIHQENYKHSSLYVRYAQAAAAAFAAPDDYIATLYQNIGDYHTDTGDLGKALDAYRNMEAVFAQLMAAETENPEFKNGLAISYSKLGETHSDLGNLPQALTFFEERSRLGKELHEAFPQNVQFKNGLAISYSKLGGIYLEKKDTPKAKAHFQQAETLWKELVRDAPQYAQFRKFLGIVQSVLSGLE